MPERESADVTPVDADLAAVAGRLRSATVQVLSRGGRGSGVVTPDGAIITNAHVAGRRRARIVTDDGRDLPGEVTARAPERDLAVIRIPAGNGLRCVEFRDTRSLRVGELVLAVGHPLDLVGALTSGIIHSVDPSMRRVVADLQLLPGNSGGPLADATGCVVGVNAMVVDGLAVAISTNVVRRFLAAPGSRPYIGVAARPVEVPVMGERRLGLLITGVADRSPAERARLIPGRIVIGIDGSLLRSPDGLAIAVESADVGSRLRLDVLDGDRVGGIEVIVGDAGRTAAAA